MLEERLNKQDYHLRTNRTQLANLATCSIGDATTHFWHRLHVWNKHRITFQN